jgi:hypothetical protein
MLRQLFTKNGTQKNRNMKRRAMQLESLETRCVLSGFSSTFSSTLSNSFNDNKIGAVVINGTEDNDKIVITETEKDFIKVNDLLPQAGDDGGAFALAMSNVRSMVVNGRDFIDARGISGLESTKGPNTNTLNGDEVNDMIHGLGDMIHGLDDMNHGLDDMIHGLDDMNHGLGDMSHGLGDMSHGLGGNHWPDGDDGDDCSFGGSGNDWNVWWRR